MSEKEGFADDEEDKKSEKSEGVDLNAEIPAEGPDTPPEHSAPNDEPVVTYPEGGLRAWLVVLGSFCAMLGAFGILNTRK